MFPQLILAKIAAVAAVVLVAFTTGWVVNGWRYKAEAAKVQAAYAKALSDAELASRAKEQSLQAAANAERSKKDAEINVVRSQLDAALVQLRNRPLRRADGVPGPAGVASPATGRELSREDAEFLTREAARAAEIDVELRNCYATYNAVRDRLR